MTMLKEAQTAPLGAIFGYNGLNLVQNCMGVKA
jgi:hypothetical protein